MTFDDIVAELKDAGQALADAKAMDDVTNQSKLAELAAQAKADADAAAALTGHQAANAKAAKIIADVQTFLEQPPTPQAPVAAPVVAPVVGLVA